MIPILDSIIGFFNGTGSKLIDMIPTEAKKAEARLLLTQEMNSHVEKLTELITSIDKAQLEINKVEAQSSSIFVSGWRPGVAWVCVAAFTWAYVLQPVVTFTATAVGHPIEYLPSLNMGDMMPVLLGLLGLGTLRTIEKKNGTQNSH